MSPPGALKTVQDQDNSGLEGERRNAQDRSPRYVLLCNTGSGFACLVHLPARIRIKDKYCYVVYIQAGLYKSFMWFDDVSRLYSDIDIDNSLPSYTMYAFR